ncbi:hypothetical protein ACE1B4_09355 [Aeromonas veronii]|uniref:hypothetical protein n=1 Tax=Aeromonas TaxID=642 RepID=UPI0011176851|nr:MULTISPECIES: hypothetical protein [Aeromonas]HDO1313700.1 hypothetical protein [Aeromonas veronii]HDO1322603.1 hypothetical protein [Aeromonas veronii]HDO1326867.1 hypothetical protein [Aeromonas veronii]HDO1377014.1 hypothetical protein [Aeromonas veronii]
MKKIIYVGILAAIGLVAPAVSAPIVSTKTLQVSWAGVVPVSPISTGEWRFVSLADPSMDFVPTMGMIHISPLAMDGSHGLQTTDIAFGIKSKLGAVFTDTSKVTAYLASSVGFQGLNPTAASADPVMTLSANGTTLGIGSSAAVEIASISGSSTDFIPITLNGKGSLPAKSFTAGDNFAAHATVMLTASVGS